MKILIVDDSKVMRSIIQRGLRQAGYNGDIDEACDGFEALDKLDSSVSLVLIDINMPRMNGITLVKEIRKRGNTAPILMITTESAKERIEEAISSGATAYMTKPFTLAKIKKHLAALYL